jgi:GntR family carbon starvation induced transcriptional regulator
MNATSTRATSSVTTTQSLPELVHNSIRADIVAGRIAPGAALRLSALATKYDVSMSVVREALIRLAEHNLVTSTPKTGFRVVETSRFDILDLLELRIHLEGLALRKSITLGGIDWEARVVAAHHVLERAQRDVVNESGELQAGTTEEWAIAHSEFHEALGAACASPRLVAMTNSLRDGAEIYRQLSAGTERSAARDVDAEHRTLMTLAVERQADRAVDALAAHLRLTAEALLASLLSADAENVT